MLSAVNMGGGVGWYKSETDKVINIDQSRLMSATEADYLVAYLHTIGHPLATTVRITWETQAEWIVTALPGYMIEVWRRKDAVRQIGQHLERMYKCLS